MITDPTEGFCCKPLIDINWYFISISLGGVICILWRVGGRTVNRLSGKWSARSTVSDWLFIANIPSFKPPKCDQSKRLSPKSSNFFKTCKSCAAFCNAFAQSRVCRCAEKVGVGGEEGGAARSSGWHLGR